MKINLFIFLILFTFSAIKGQAQSIVISGFVKAEESKKGLNKTKILIIQNQISIDSTFTDKSGNFTFNGLSDGVYDIKIIKKKYFVKELNNVAIKSKGFQIEDIYLQKYIIL